MQACIKLYLQNGYCLIVIRVGPKYISMYLTFRIITSHFIANFDVSLPLSHVLVLNGASYILLCIIIDILASHMITYMQMTIIISICILAK